MTIFGFLKDYYTIDFAELKSEEKKALSTESAFYIPISMFKINH